MKRIIALAAAVAVSTVFARITATNDFESSSADFVASDSAEDSSELVSYDNDEPAFTAPVPYATAGFGQKYLNLDTGDATLWRTNAVEGTVYFDMAMQFNPSSEAPTLAEGTKVAVYQNSSSNVVIVAGPVSGETPTEYVTTTQIAPGTWGRLTISAVQGASGFDFTVRLNGTALTDGTVTSFPSMTADATITHVGFAGSGKLDDFVARTTDPYLANPAVQVGDEGYASIADALADAGADAVVELLANNADAVTLGSGESLKLKLGEYAYSGTITLPDGYIVSAGTPDANGVTTYSQVEGVAAVSRDGNTWTWFATFEEAYENALLPGAQPDLKVKINGDFAPSGISASKVFYTITFLYDAEDNNPATIVLTNGNYKVTATEKYSFPANATLVLPADFTVKNANSLLGASGVLNIPEGVKVTLRAYRQMNDLAGVTGAGTIDVASDPDLFIYYNENNLPKFLRAEGWKGVLEISGSYGYSREWNFADFGNLGSTIRFKGLTASYLDSSKEHAIGAVELVGDGFTFNGAPTDNKDIVVSSAVRGSGALNVAATSKRTTFQFTGDVSDFTGNVTVSGTGRVAFGSDKAGTAPVIYVHQGASVTNAAGATWSATNVIVSGELVANGTMSATKLWGDSGTGVYRANNSAAAIDVASSWNGTYYANFDSGNVRFAFDVATSASATTVINGANGAFSGYPKSNGAAPNVAGSVVLNANWTIGDGWKGTDSATTFAKLSGSGNLTVDGSASYTDRIYYNITELDGYNGTLGGRRGNFTISKVNVATQPANGTRVVKTNIGANGAINNNVPLYVAGVDTGKTLTYDASGADGAGLYYYEPDTPAIPVVSPGTNNVIACASAEAAAEVAAAMNAAKSTYIVAPAAAGLSGEAAATYAGYFNANVDGTGVVIEMNETGTNALATASTDVAAQVAADLSAIAVTADATTVNITGAAPGFYYSVVYDDNLATLDTAGTEGARALANADGSVTLTIPAKESGATSGFYRVKVSVKAND